MSRQGRYWLFFVIVAVGLALSWGQIGRKTVRVFEESAVVYLVPEAVCRPRQQPCAAMAHDRALVLGPADQGLAVKQAGFDLSAVVSIEAVFLAADNRILDEMRLTPSRGGWRFDHIPATASVLRVSVVEAHETTVAEYPL